MLIVIRASSLRGGLSQFPVLCRQLVAGSCRLARSPERVSAVPAVQNHHSVKFPRIGVECVGGGCMAALLLGRSQWTPHHPNTHTHTGGFSPCVPSQSGRRASVTPRSLAGCSFSTPIGSEVTSSIPSSVKPAFSSLTYFSHSAVLEQCLALFPL